MKPPTIVSNTVTLHEDLFIVGRATPHRRSSRSLPLRCLLLLFMSRVVMDNRGRWEQNGVRSRRSIFVNKVDG